MHDLQTRAESCIAYCQKPDDPDSQAGFTIHGVALAPEDVNRGSVNGEPTEFVFPEDVLAEAAGTLEGQPIVDVHTDDGDGRIEYPPPAEITVGKVTKAGFDPGTGVLYEAVIADEELAQRIEAGVLDVSPEVGFDAEEQSDGTLRATEAHLFGLAIVSIGGAPSNSAAAGPNEALATLSVAGINALLSASGTDDGTTTPSSGNETPEAPADADSGTEQGTIPADSGSDSTVNTNMGDNPDDTPDVDALLERLDEKEERIDELEAQTEELTEQTATLEERNETLEEEISEVKQGYAAVLAEDGPFPEEDLVDNFDVATLRERFEDRFEDGFAATISEPDVQSGAGGSGDGTPDEAAEAVAEEYGYDDVATAAEELEAQYENYARAGWESNAENLKDDLETLGVEVS